MQNSNAREKFLAAAAKYGFAWEGVPKTGQKTSYADYDDGYYQYGKPIITTRFTDLGDGTILDNSTRLIWLKEPRAWSDFGISGTSMKTMNWATALTTCKNFTAQGQSDWRLPNLPELMTLGNRGNTNPAIGEETRGDGGSQLPFVGIGNTIFWTSTTVRITTSTAWSLSMVDGAPYDTNKGTLLTVMPTRGGAV